jgi:hypothetical protein
MTMAATEREPEIAIKCKLPRSNLMSATQAWDFLYLQTMPMQSEPLRVKILGNLKVFQYL